MREFFLLLFLSTNDCWCQLNTNKNLHLACSEEENFIQRKTAQLWYSMVVKITHLWGCPGVRTLSSYLCSFLYWSALHCAGLLHFMPKCSGLGWASKASSTFQLSQGNAVFCGKGKCAFQATEAGLYRQKSLALVPGWFVLMQIRNPNLHSLIGSKGTVLIGKKRATLIVWNCTSPIEWEKPQSYWLQ